MTRNKLFSLELNVGLTGSCRICVALIELPDFQYVLSNICREILYALDNISKVHLWLLNINKWGWKLLYYTTHLGGPVRTDLQNETNKLLISIEECFNFSSPPSYALRVTEMFDSRLLFNDLFFSLENILQTKASIYKSGDKINKWVPLSEARGQGEETRKSNYYFLVTPR